MVHLFRLVLTLTAILLLSFDQVESRIVSGSIDTKSDTVFIDRFVFTPQDASLFKYDIKYRKAIDDTDVTTATVPHALTQNDHDRDVSSIVSRMRKNVTWSTGHEIHYFYRLVIYDDFRGQWPYVRANEDKLTCREKQDVAIRGGRPVRTLSPHSNGACKEEREDDIPVIHCQGAMYWTGYDFARWWFITVQNCGTYPEAGVSMTYNFTMMNGNNPLNWHFSADEQYILQTNMIAIAFYVVIFVFVTMYRFRLKEKRMLHVTYRLFYCTVILQLLAVICLTIYLGLYSRDGVREWPSLEITGHMLSSAGTLVFILNTILLAKGYTITRGKISTLGCVKITIFMTVYSITYGVLYFYKEVMADPRDVMYLYDSPAGYGLIALRCLGTFWVYYAVAITLKHFPEKKPFYFLYTIFFTLWFSIEPAMILLTTFYVESYQRAQIVNGCYWVVTIMGHIFFLILTRPDDANKRFPFHLRVNQVGFLDIGDVECNQPSMKYRADEGFSHIFAAARPETTYAAPPLPMRNNFFPDVENEVVGAETSKGSKGENSNSWRIAKPLPMRNNFFPDVENEDVGAETSRGSEGENSNSWQTAKPLTMRNNFFPDAENGDIVAETSKGSKGKNSNSWQTAKIGLPVPKTDFSIFLGNALPEASDKLITTKPNEENTITTTIVTSIRSNDDHDDDELAPEETPEPAAEPITTKSNEENTITTAPVTLIRILSNGDHDDRDDHDDHSTHSNIPSNIASAGDRDSVVNIPLDKH